MKWRLAVSFCLLICGALTALGQEVPGTWRVEVPASIGPGEIEEVRIVFDVTSPWHMYAPTPANEALGVVGLGMAFDLPDDLTASGPRFPPVVNKGRHDVFEGPRIPAQVRLRAVPGARPGERAVKGWVQYQFCQPSFCLPPRRDALAFTINIE